MSQRLSYGQSAVLATHPVAKRLFQLMENKKTNLAFSADVTSAQQLLELADHLGPEICVLKTHIDILEDFTPAVIEKLRVLADQHRFMIFEDRKFADIGNTVQMQYAKGIYRMVDWADIVNAHVLPGPGIIEGLKAEGMKKGRGLLLLAEMSSQGNLMDAAYVDKTVAMAKAHSDFVFGFIAQRRFSDTPGMVYMTPGVQLSENSDTLGQSYRTPEQVLTEQGCDVIIVGRGILKAVDPLKAAIIYRQTGWAAYLEALKRK